MKYFNPDDLCYSGEYVKEIQNVKFTVKIDPDHSYDTPWNNGDGNGIVSDRVQRAKRPGERLLQQDSGWSLYYDFKATVQRATADGWGISPDRIERLASNLKREPTKREIIVAAVEQDFQHLKEYCNGDWCYVFVNVKAPAIPEFNVPEFCEWIGGIESTDTECIAEYANQYITDHVTDICIAQLDIERKKRHMLSLVASVAQHLHHAPAQVLLDFGTICQAAGVEFKGAGDARGTA